MYVNRFVDDSLAFACGWNYWYAYAILVASEVTAASIVVEYWTDKVPVAVWITIFLVSIVILNIIAVSVFGECEFWFASIKILGIIGLIIVGIVIFFGGAPTHDRLGFRYWKHDAFKEYIVKGDSGRFCGFWNALIRSDSPSFCLLSSSQSLPEKPRLLVETFPRPPSDSPTDSLPSTCWDLWSLVLLCLETTPTSGSRQLWRRRRRSLSLRHWYPERRNPRAQPYHQRRDSDFGLVCRKLLPLCWLKNHVLSGVPRRGSGRLQAMHPQRCPLPVCGCHCCRRLSGFP